MNDRSEALDSVTFEVLKNGFVNLVDQMSEQLLRTCYSFVIYCRDFSNCLCDAEGETVMQGSGDIAVHVGTLHFTCKAVIERFKGDIHPGDVFLINDPYRGGTHFSDVRVVRPVFVGDRLIAFTQSNGHWADIGGSVPGSTGSDDVALVGDFSPDPNNPDLAPAAFARFKIKDPTRDTPIFNAVASVAVTDATVGALQFSKNFEAGVGNPEKPPPP